MSDFHQRFQHYSNIDLLKIVNRPDNYQPEAIETAKQILSSRLVSDEELKEVESLFQNQALKQLAKKEKVDSYKQRFDDFLEPIFKPGNQVSPKKWLAIFLVLVAIQYIYVLAKSIIDVIKYEQRELPFDFELAI